MSIEIIKIEDLNDNLVYLLEQYKGKDNFESIIRSFNDELQKTEDANFEIRDNFFVDTAEGVQLDILGTIFNAERNGRSDEDYRTLIKLEASKAFSGSPEEIITLLKGIYGATEVEYIPGYPTNPAAFFVRTDISLTESDLELIAPAGVEARVGDILVFDEAQTPIYLENGDTILIS